MPGTWIEWGSAMGSIAVRPTPLPTQTTFSRSDAPVAAAQKSPFKLVADKVASVVYPSPRAGLADAFAAAAPKSVSPVAAVAEASGRNKRVVSFVPAPEASCVKRAKAAAPRQRAARKSTVRVKSDVARSQPRRQTRRMASGFYSEKNLQNMACVHHPVPAAAIPLSTAPLSRDRALAAGGEARARAAIRSPSSKRGRSMCGTWLPGLGLTRLSVAAASLPRQPLRAPPDVLLVVSRAPRDSAARDSGARALRRR